MASPKSLTALKRFSSCDVRPITLHQPSYLYSRQIPASTLTITNRDHHITQIGDALVKLKVPYGGYLHGLKMFSPEQQAGETKIFGPAYTVQLVDANNTTAPKPAKHFADGIEKDCVVFISQPKGFYSACWGGLMSTRAKYLGAQGVVVDGCFRDINEHRGMGFPVGGFVVF
jgi:regulator of RNase E activity RraA